MRAWSVLLWTAFAAGPASALDLIELKSGRVIPVEEATRVGDKLHVRLAMPEGQRAATAFPIAQIVPEFVFYVWLRDLPEKDRDAHLELAEWARRNGLFRHALKVYRAAAEIDEGIRADLPGLERTLREEEATWLFETAERLFKADEVRDARVLVGMLLEGFEDSTEAGRAAELAKMIDEREKFLSEERRRKEAAQRAERQRIEVRTQAARIAQGDAYAASVNLRYVGEARWRLRWAGYLYELAAARLSALLPFVEDEGLRREIERHLDAVPGRIVAAYLRLADLRYLAGDLGAALDAAHRILDVDPKNAAATALRDRILDGPGPTHIRRDRGFLSYRRRFEVPVWDPFWRLR